MVYRNGRSYLGARSQNEQFTANCVLPTAG